MTKKRSLAVILVGVAAIACGAAADLAHAQTSSSAALTGRVSSQEEPRMEGVLVSAKRAGSTVTITVVSDAQGRYSFPRAKLAPGRHSVRIRAVGYELDDPGPVEITAQTTTQLDLKLRKAGDLAYQLSNGEWIMSLPGTEEQKDFLYHDCVECHTLERIVRSRYNATEFLKVRERMGTYSTGTTPLRPQKKRYQRAEDTSALEEMAKEAQFLSTINLSAVSQWQYPLKTLPRPKGKGTRVIITEYDLPRPDAQPHDAIVDSEGMVWYSDFGQQYLGKLDPKTAKVVEYPVPVLKPGFPTGANSVELDRDGNVWLGMMIQEGIAKFDRKTQTFQTWSAPKKFESDVPQISKVIPRYLHLDGKVWMTDRVRWGLHRLDVRTGEFQTFEAYKDLSKDSPIAARENTVYGIDADSQNNIYFLSRRSELVGRVDAKTGKATYYATPTFESQPRRGHMDSQDRLWFAEFKANKIGMFDTKTNRFREWAIPSPWFNPYDAILDKNGDAWAGGMNTDRVVRLNTKTAEFTEYLLPRSTNIRRVDVDNSTNPVTFWVGNNHGASLIKLEPLD